MAATEGRQDLLAGIRVVDFSQFYAGPVSGRILAEMGAEVILLEQAGRIDPTRQMTTIGGVDFSTPPRPKPAVRCRQPWQEECLYRP